MVTCTDRGIIDIWDAKTWQVIKSIKAHPYVALHFYYLAALLVGGANFDCIL